MIFKISGLTWGIVSLSPVICGSNRYVPPPIQTRLTYCPRCIYSSILGYSRCLPLFKFFTVNDSNHSTVCESFYGSVCPSHAKIRLRYFCEKQFCVRKKNSSSLSMNSMITWKHGPTYWIIEHVDKMVKKTEQKMPSNLPRGRHKTFLNNLSNSHNFVTFIVFFNSTRVWACTWLVLCSLEQKVLFIQSW